MFGFIVYFKEFQEFSTKMGILFVLGLGIVFLGVYLLSTSPPPKRKQYHRVQGSEPIGVVVRQNSMSGLRDLASPLVVSTSSQTHTLEERSTVSSQNSMQRLNAEYVTVTSIRSAMPAVGDSFPPFLTQEEQEALVNMSDRVSKMHFSFGMPMLSAVQHDMWTTTDDLPPLQRSDTM